MKKLRQRRLPRVFPILGLFLGAFLGACNGCKQPPAKDSGSVSAEVGTPSVRIYFLADVAGALEPCGCQKDMLGGLDHFGALMTSEKAKAPNAIVISAGPLFYMDTQPKADRAEQDDWKAEALAKGLGSCGLAAFTPGKNDWASGASRLDGLRTASGAPLVAANLEGAAAGAVRSTVREIGGVKVAIVGVAVPKDAKGAPTGLSIGDATKVLREEAKAARAAGARIVIGVASLDRGEALRAADGIPELDVLALGSTASDGDVNDAPQAPRFVGPTLVVQPSNHLTRTAIVDFYVRGAGRFADGSGLEKSAETTKLQADIDDLDRRIVNWESNKNVSQADIDAQKKRLAEMRQRLAKASEPPPPPAGSFLRYTLVDVKQSLGSDPSVATSMKAFYKRVNEENAKKFAGRRAPAPGKDDAQYVGVEVCKVCHSAAYDVWKKNDHSNAYKTLADGSKEFNLDCVGCHVTGFEKPGGSSVTDVKDLANVQCESCHGPGSKHVADPSSGGITLLAEESTCVACHHPPHVSDFVYAQRIDKIKGPGHGKPGAPAHNDPPKGWKPPPLRF